MHMYKTHVAGSWLVGAVRLLPLLRLVDSPVGRNINLLRLCLLMAVQLVPAVDKNGLNRESDPTVADNQVCCLFALLATVAMRRPVLTLTGRTAIRGVPAAAEASFFLADGAL